MPQGKRRKWEKEDSNDLISLWDVVGSVALIAIMLKRTRSSVQTQASRLELPPRVEPADHHRRRWTDSDDARLRGYLASVTLSDGMIPIQKLADLIGRSVDAVVDRLDILYGEESDIMARLVAPPMPIVPPKVLQKHTPRANGVVMTKNNQARTKNCLRCRMPFWSPGNHSWICKNCKRSDEWQESV